MRPSGRRRRLAAIGALAGSVFFASSASSAPPVEIATPAVATGTAQRGAAVVLSDPAYPGPQIVRVGTAALGREFDAIHRKGSLEADRTVVVVGVIHGDERAGRLVTGQLERAALPADLDLWIIPTMNPDGEAAGRHQNARGVDLNRNWPANWESGTYYSSGKYFSGPRPASEPETRAMMAFLAAIDPDITIWYHAPWNRVDCNQARVGRTCVDFAARVGSYSAFTPRPGTATDWVMTAGHGRSFIYEFASSTPTAATIRAHVDAVVALS
jgi:murein peptide amidase A